jgi:hypothetical protein
VYTFAGGCVGGWAGSEGFVGGWVATVDSAGSVADSELSGAVVSGCVCVAAVLSFWVDRDAVPSGAGPLWGPSLTATTSKATKITASTPHIHFVLMPFPPLLFCLYYTPATNPMQLSAAFPGLEKFLQKSNLEENSITSLVSKIILAKYERMLYDITPTI